MKRDRLALETLGCKLNQAESDSIRRQFFKAGYQITQSPAEADIYILNTCTVTHIADRKARHRLRQVRHANPQALIIATGCYAQRAPAELKGAGVDLVMGNRQKGYLPQLLEAERKGGDISSPCSHPQSRTRALVKIQDGCNSCCTFCIVPSVRGREYSISPELVLAEVKARVAEGYREVVLTGTNIGSCQWNGNEGLPSLIKHILNETGIERLRLSSLQPQELTSGLLELWEKDERLCPHLHIPLQSGSDKVLQWMGRRYSIADFERAVSLAREAIPDVDITTDILVGFPGEGEGEFEESYRFTERVGFANIHVFSYSPRPTTRAAGMSHQVEGRVKKWRSQRMLALAQRSAHHFRERFLGRTMPVLWEGEKERGIWRGLTPNYLRVFVRSEAPLSNCLLPVKLVSEYKGELWGELP
jgi:threonylcarbamoyladenosine tRNA methylthiotransferase MtaB